ncbi:hypothetical protein FE810_14695 [Thalassotalea litorea]|uniref:Uncharacterized protein n=1 Tax=Thalassotalea litorea TaxID=2020715 RepID=A0A5R9IJJ0_9GAMM|nr:hypothetical protein [Thalassotalea litorea]TLU61482.1 hypothetical protein FE810_14695 [Thalassotalea litorea]
MIKRIELVVLSTSGLTVILLLLAGVLGSYSLSALSQRNALQDQELPMDISANRYLQVGDWPESDPNNSLIRDFQSFIVKDDAEKTNAKSKSNLNLTLTYTETKSETKSDNRGTNRDKDQPTTEIQVKHDE